MVTTGTTSCSVSISSQKENKKKWGEICKYLQNRIDRTRIFRKVGNVLVVDLEALEQVKEEESAGQRRQKRVAVGYCSYGPAYPPRDKRGGDRLARRQKQRANRGRSRDDCMVSQVLAHSLSPLHGGSDSRISDTPGKLQILQQFTVAGFEMGNRSGQIRTKQSMLGWLTQPID